MKIGIDVSQMCYAGTGVGRYVYGLTHALLSMDSPHRYVLFAGALRQAPYFHALKQTAPWNKAEWKILPLPPKLSGLVFNSLNFPIERLIGTVDVFHSSDWSQPISRGSSVTTVHDLVFIKYPETVDPLILATQTKRLKRVVATGTQIIADSKSTKNDLVETYGLPVSRIDVVYPSISSNFVRASKTEIDRVKTKYKLPDQYLFSLGTQEPRKNISRLVDAVKKLDIPLVIAGRHGWGSKTLTIGHVDDSDLPALYSGASVFVYPSLYEGFGFPVLEAMACGTPVVTSDTSSLREVAGSAAILVDPKSVASIKAGIESALSSSARLIPLGLKQAKQFTWETTAKQVLEVYEKTINRN